MKALLDAIKFNHDSSSANIDALNIRKNETQFVSVPEWQRGISVNPEDSLAAYACRGTQGNTLTIQAKFSISDPTLQALEIRAIDPHIRPTLSSILLTFMTWLLQPALRQLTGNVLGEVKGRYVFPSNGETDYETFELENVRIWDVGVGVHDIEWRWQYRQDPSDYWKYFATSRHRIYTVLRVPKPPWEQTPFNSANTQLPWAEVLDYACRWAATAIDADNAAALVTRCVNDLGQSGLLQFDNKCGGHEFYTTTPDQPQRGKFDCTAFLDRLNGGRGNGKYVNCTDCATIVSSFANSVGCDLSQLLIGFFYRLKPHQRIGSLDWLHNQEFFHHDVAWNGEGRESDELNDASLRLDGDAILQTHPALLATNLRFGLPGERMYRFRLVLPEDEATCLPQSRFRTRRTIGIASCGSVINDKTLLEFAKQHYAYESWADIKPPEDNLFVLSFFLRKNEFPGWRLDRLQLHKAEGRAPIIESYWTSLKESDELSIRIDAYECLSRHDARVIMLGVLARFQLPGIVRRVPPDFGDVAFTGQDDCPIVFARANHVFLLRNVGEKTASLKETARRIDEQVNKEPIASEETPSRVRRFRLSDPEAKVGHSVLLEDEMPTTLGHLWMYRFFSPTGEVYIERDSLAYKADSPGLQLIKIYAVDEYDNVVSYVLEFYAI